MLAKCPVELHNFFNVDSYQRKNQKYLLLFSVLAAVDAFHELNFIKLLKV